MHPKDVANLDQSLAVLVDFLPKLWWGVYREMQIVGFTEPQAMDILKTYIATSCRPDSVDNHGEA